jgi:hypothetical protein
MLDPNFQTEIRRNEHVIQEIYQNDSKYHTFRGFTIINCILFKK